MEQYYISNPDGTQSGPMSQSEVQQTLDASPDLAADRLVWSETTVDWVSPPEAGFQINQPAKPIPAPTLVKPETEIPQVTLQAKQPPVSNPTPIAAKEPHNPYHAPKSSIGTVEPEYPGFGRLTAALVYVGYFSAAFALGFFARGSLINHVETISTVGGYIVQIFCVGMRYRNMGKSGWWGFGIFIPLYSLWVLFLSVAGPPGYFDNEQFDRTGWIIGWIILASIIVGVVGIIAF